MFDIVQVLLWVPNRSLAGHGSVIDCGPGWCLWVDASLIRDFCSILWLSRPQVNARSFTWGICCEPTENISLSFPGFVDQHLCCHGPPLWILHLLTTFSTSTQWGFLFPFSLGVTSITWLGCHYHCGSVTRAEFENTMKSTWNWL